MYYQRQLKSAEIFTRQYVKEYILVIWVIFVRKQSLFLTNFQNRRELSNETLGGSIYINDMFFMIACSQYTRSDILLCLQQRNYWDAIALPKYYNKQKRTEKFLCFPCPHFIRPLMSSLQNKAKQSKIISQTFYKPIYKYHQQLGNHIFPDPNNLLQCTQPPKHRNE